MFVFGFGGIGDWTEGYMLARQVLSLQQHLQTLGSNSENATIYVKLSEKNGSNSLWLFPIKKYFYR
jgi:hypothetical protein